MAALPLEGRERIILSIAQFRPEKDHPGQLHAFHALLEKYPEYRGSGLGAVQLVLVGGSRNVDDATRVKNLRLLASELSVQEEVRFVVNASFPDMLGWLSRAIIGLGTMIDEHLGINIVEFMAAGAIVVAHKSGEPLLDIVVHLNGEPTGYHAISSETFAEAFHTVFTLSSKANITMLTRARTWAVEKFSTEEFEKGWDESGWKTWL